MAAQRRCGGGNGSALILVGRLCPESRPLSALLPGRTVGEAGGSPLGFLILSTVFAEFSPVLAGPTIMGEERPTLGRNLAALFHLRIVKLALLLEIR